MSKETKPAVDFESIWGKIESTLTSAGEKLTLAEVSRRRELTARAINKYGGGTVVESAAKYEEPPEEDIRPDDPTVLIIPEPPTNPYWYDDPKDRMVLDHAILARRKLGNAMQGAVLITGPAGIGKSTSVRKSVERLNMAREPGSGVLNLFKMDCATVTDPGKWFGRREADKDGTHFVPSDFWISVERGDVVLLDDVFRLHPHIHNPIMSLLDGFEEVHISDLNEVLHRHPKTVFIGTANQGSQYGGNHRPDWAMRERFSTTINRDAPPPDEEVRILTSATNCDEDAAATLVQIANKTRDMSRAGDLRSSISTRTLVAAAMWVGFGMREWDALDITAVQEFDGDASGLTGAESDRDKVLGIMEGRLGRGRA